MILLESQSTTHLEIQVFMRPLRYTMLTMYLLIINNHKELHLLEDHNSQLEMTHMNIFYKN